MFRNFKELKKIKLYLVYRNLKKKIRKVDLKYYILPIIVIGFNLGVGIQNNLIKKEQIIYLSPLKISYKKSIKDTLIIILMIVSIISGHQTRKKINNIKYNEENKLNKTLKIINFEKNKKNKNTYIVKDIQTKRKYLLKKNKSKKSLHVGDYIRGNYIACKIPKSTNPGQFDYKKFLIKKGYSGILEVQSYVLVKKGYTYHPKNIGLKIKKKLLKYYQKYLPTEQTSLITSLILGSSAPPITDKVKNNFRKTGLTHLLVVSGAQVALLSGILIQLMKKTKNKKKNSMDCLINKQYIVEPNNRV